MSHGFSLDTGDSDSELISQAQMIAISKAATWYNCDVRQLIFAETRGRNSQGMYQTRRSKWARPLSFVANIPKWMASYSVRKDHERTI